MKSMMMMTLMILTPVLQLWSQLLGVAGGVAEEGGVAQEREEVGLVLVVGGERKEPVPFLLLHRVWV